ncbi:putative GNAT family N-acyltransferase [Weissella uvarum]|uniref:GNAT family N-acetyltransferase n=1 Tax=Weissella uvarum TaxID=1479233 RepID=UPI00196152AA|nr:GNAT family N-acetyltransferase [Weissella uvarum]MBM7616962.1 putative GNAT family N-acyltransferase [Weissella uvarum]MCM0594589.1 GNAT family N-acetyltransferase [Weissella uvarum]
MPATDLVIKHHVGASSIQTDAQSIRQTVFVKEQGISQALEFDQLDAQAMHWVGYLNNIPVTTCRVLLFPEKRVAKLQRVATLPPYRSQHFGTTLLLSIIAFFQQHPKINTLVLDAQLPAQTFYQHLDFQPQGEPFEEAGISHVKMVRHL